MIVVDTNVVAYAVLPGDRTESSLAVAERDPAWIAPALWRFELRNVLATAMRLKSLRLPAALAAFSAAENLVADAELLASTEECLRLAARGGVSAYDAEFVLVAERLDLPLVTADRKLAKAFPGLTISPEAFARGG
ncbi:MAG TPA: type II toxin-antitoxin system VapC family toxin [Thermoanaerobaculia bacterium]|jgi:predicted nucleic acid-binding protein|nr:type II toxin-antitoxin system VapC family toxin [Thermoanaerobaculia bacterium]